MSPHISSLCRIDRFGKEDTAFFAPFGTPFAMRSLPPSSLNDEYDVYQVTTPPKTLETDVEETLEVLAGPAARGFEQSGLGTQYIAEHNPDVLDNAGLLRRVSHDEVVKLYSETTTT